eukprot:TCONS_00067726-protein
MISASRNVLKTKHHILNVLKTGMANIDEQIGIIMHILGCISHIAGCYILLNTSHSNHLMDSQRLYLIYLSISEGLYCLAFTLFYIGLGYQLPSLKNFSFIIGSGFYLFYICIIMLLTMDRVLNARMHRTYLALWSRKRAHLSACCSGILALATTIVSIIMLPNFEISFKIMSLYIYPTIGFTCVFFLIFSYVYLFHKIRSFRICYIAPMIVISPVQVVNKESSVNQDSGSQSTVDNNQQIERNNPGRLEDDQSQQSRRNQGRLENQASEEELRSEFETSEIHGAEEEDNGQPPHQNNNVKREQVRGQRRNQRNLAYEEGLRSEFETSEIHGAEEEDNERPRQSPSDQNGHEQSRGRKRQQQQQQQVNRIYEHLKRSICVPVLLVLTYIVFYIIPDQMHFWMHLANKELSGEVLILFGVLYPMSPISDAFIYIFFRRQSRQFLKRQLLRFLESVDLR